MHPALLLLLQLALALARGGALLLQLRLEALVLLGQLAQLRGWRRRGRAKRRAEALVVVEEGATGGRRGRGRAVVGAALAVEARACALSTRSCAAIEARSLW